MDRKANDINQVLQNYGQSAIRVMRQIAEYLKVLQDERPELFVNGILVGCRHR